jgi:hypothetical protein
MTAPIRRRASPQPQMVIAWITGGIRPGKATARRCPDLGYTMYIGRPAAPDRPARMRPDPPLTTGRTPRRPRPAAAVADLCPRPAGPGDLLRVLRTRAEGGETVQTGVLAGQAARYGVLAGAGAFGLELIEVHRLPPRDQPQAIFVGRQGS